ncbi:MAG: discoidin domain-containing protein [Polyangiaceae bacterium]
MTGSERGLGSLAAVALALASCATYEGPTNAHPSSAAGTSGSNASGDAGAGSGGVAANDTGAGSAGVNASAGAQASGAGGNAGSAGNGGAATTGGAATGGAATGGAAAGGAAAGGAAAGGAATGGAATGGAATGGAATGGAATGGAAGSLGNAGSGGGTEHLLSLGKAASADSEEISMGKSNLAGLGNDGSLTTRWCAADGAAGHYWKVDLGAADTITKLQVTWEKAAVYKFKIEGSVDGTAWSLLLDQTNSTSSTAVQTYPLSAVPKARWIRVTVTGLANSTTWASFFELSVFGY